MTPTAVLKKTVTKRATAIDVTQKKKFLLMTAYLLEVKKYMFTSCFGTLGVCISLVLLMLGVHQTSVTGYGVTFTLMMVSNTFAMTLKIFGTVLIPEENYVRRSLRILPSSPPTTPGPTTVPSKVTDVVASNVTAAKMSTEAATAAKMSTGAAAEDEKEDK